MTAGIGVISAGFNLEEYQDAPDEVRAVLERLLPDLQRMKGSVEGAFSKGLSLAKNLNATVKTVNVQTLSAWQTPSYLNGWVDFGGNTKTRYQKLPSGLVSLELTIKNGTIGADAFVLPAGYRPGFDLTVPAYNNTAAESSKLVVLSTGGVLPVNGANGIVAASSQWMAADAAPAPSITALKVASDIQGPAQGVLALQAYEAGRPELVTAPPALTWVNTGDGQVFISNAAGLAPSKTYTLTLLILGG